MNKKPVILDIGAKKYIDNEKRLYKELKKRGASESEILEEFMLEFVAVFLDTNTKHRWHVKRAIQLNNGHEHHRNAMFIYNVVTEVFPVEYEQFFEEY